MSTTLTLEDVVAATGARLAAHASPPASRGRVDRLAPLAPGELFVAVAGPRFDGHDFLAQAAARGAAAALVHRDVPAPAGFPLLRVKDTTRALADLARHVRLAAALPVVCVTGSAGKTTTKEMTAALLARLGPVLKSEGNLNNRYGLPLSLLRLASRAPRGGARAGHVGRGRAARADRHRAAGRGGDHQRRRRAPGVLRVARRDRHAKAEILEGLRAGGVAVLNGDDPRLRRVGARHPGRVVWFGLERRLGGDARSGCAPAAGGTRFELRIAGERLEVSLPLPGPHNVANFLAAAAAAHALGVEPAWLAAGGGGAGAGAPPRRAASSWATASRCSTTATTRTRPLSTPR